MTEAGLRESVTEAVARNVRDARNERGWTLEKLAHRSGVSKGMVVQIEQGRTNPSIGTLSKVSDALGVSLANLVSAPDTPVVRLVPANVAARLWNPEGESHATLLVGGQRPDFIELWEWVLGPGDAYEGRPHAPGIRELLHVLEGALTLTVAEDANTIETGASASYDGDQPHRYENAGESLVRFTLVMVDPTGTRSTR